MADEQTPSDVSIDGNVEGDLNIAGCDIHQHKTTITQLPIPKTRAGRIGLTVVVLGILVGAAFALGLPQQLGLIKPFKPASEGEVLVIVTDFTGEGVEADTRIYLALRERIDEIGLENVRVERLKGVAPRAGGEAVEIGEKFNATIVIWGTANNAGFETCYELIENRELIETNNEFETVLIAAEPSFSFYVQDSAPPEFEYLMLFSLGQIAYFKVDYYQAAALFNEAVKQEIDTERANALSMDAAYLYQGLTYQALDNYEQAIADYDTAIEVNEASQAAYTNRGIVYFMLGAYQQAIADFDRAVELDPANAVVFFNRGMTLPYLGKYDQAIADFGQAVKLDSEFTLAYHYRGSTYATMGEYDLAVADYDQAIKLNPDFALSYRSRGFVYSDFDKYEQAITDFDRAGCEQNLTEKIKQPGTNPTGDSNKRHEL